MRPALLLQVVLTFMTCNDQAAAATSVLLVHGDNDAEVADVEAKMQLDPLISVAAVSYVTPTLAEMQSHDAVFCWSNGPFLNADDLGNNLADYVDQGGKVVQAVFAFTYFPIGGRFASGGYSPVTLGSDPRGSCGGNIEIVDSSSSLVAGVTSFDGGSSFVGPSAYCDDVTGVVAEASLIANWGTGTPLIACKDEASGTVVALNFYPVSSDVEDVFWDSSTDGAKILQNAVKISSCSACGTQSSSSGGKTGKSSSSSGGKKGSPKCKGAKSSPKTPTAKSSSSSSPKKRHVRAVSAPIASASFQSTSGAVVGGVVAAVAVLAVAILLIQRRHRVTQIHTNRESSLAPNVGVQAPANLYPSESLV